MSTPFPVHPHFRPQFWVGGFLALWLYLFLAFVGPFDAAELPLRIRSLLMVGYGIVFWGCYLLCFPIQSWWLKRKASWIFQQEILFVLCFVVLCFGPTYAYYITDWVNGTFTVTEFLGWVYLPTIAILIPVLIAGRYLVGLQYQRKTQAEIEMPLFTITGNNKLDVLRLSPTELLAVSAADNYVTAYYLQQDTIQKRLLRTTLKQVQQEVPELLRIHRSHLINPLHFRAWQDNKTIQIHNLRLPVSKKYKTEVDATLQFTPL